MHGHVNFPSIQSQNNGSDALELKQLNEICRLPGSYQADQWDESRTEYEYIMNYKWLGFELGGDTGIQIITELQ